MMQSLSITDILNVGSVGICLVALAIYYIKKDKKNDDRTDKQLVEKDEIRKEMIKMNQDYQKQLNDIMIKYATAMARLDQTLNSLIKMLQRR